MEEVSALAPWRAANSQNVKLRNVKLSGNRFARAGGAELHAAPLYTIGMIFPP